MGKQERLELIKKIEALRGTKVICYIINDRPGIGFAMGHDDVRIFYEHLNLIPKGSKIDLIIYGPGGDSSVPWRIVSMIREFSSNFSVLVPSKAFSAATMVAIGADDIVMGDKGELGPIDPSVWSEFNPRDPFDNRQLRINVEDVTAYIDLIKSQSKVGLKEEKNISDIFKYMTEKINPLALGFVNRHHSYIRMVAKKLLESHNNKLSPEQIDKIIKGLIEETYFHGHSIRRKEAKDIGLKIENAGDQLNGILWQLYLEYEKEMKLNKSYIPDDIFYGQKFDEYVEENVIAAYIESVNRNDKMWGKVSTTSIRKIPEKLDISIPIQLPSTIDPKNITEELRQFIQQLQPEVQKMVYDQIKTQSQITGYQNKFIKFEWVQE